MKAEKDEDIDTNQKRLIALAEGVSLDIFQSEVFCPTYEALSSSICFHISFLTLLSRLPSSHANVLTGISVRSLLTYKTPWQRNGVMARRRRRFATR